MGRPKTNSLIAYNVVCNARKFIQSVSLGMPGTHNDKHIVKLDTVAVSLHRGGSSWLRNKSWTVNLKNGTSKTFHGLYLIVDGGYIRWPCLVCPLTSLNDDINKLSK